MKPREATMSKRSALAPLVLILCDFLKSKKSDATCELVPGKTHFDIAGDVEDATGLTWRVEHEMAAAAGVK